MTNEVVIRVSINDATQPDREKIKAAFAAMGAEAAAAFSTTASKGMKDAGGNVGADASDAFREMAMLGFGVAGADAAKEFTAKATPGVKNGGSDAGAEASDAFRELAVFGFGVAGTDAAKEFNEKAKETLGKGVEPKLGPTSEAPIEPPVEPKTDEPASEETGKKTTAAVARGMTMRQQLIASAIAGALLGGGPLVDAAAIGTGVVFLTAMGATVQRGNPALQAGWAKLRDDATSSAQAASMGIVGPLSQAMDQLDGLISREAPLIKKMFDDAGSDIPILAQGVDNFVTNSLPGLESGLANSQQVMSATAGVAGDLGQAVGEIGSSFGQNSSSAVTGLKALGSVVVEAGHDVSELVDFTTRLASGALPVLASGFNGVLGAAGAVLHVLEPIAPVLGSITAYGVEAWGSFKLASVAQTGVENLGKQLTKLSTDLGAYATKAQSAEGSSSRISSAMGAAASVGAGFASKAADIADKVAGPMSIALGVGSMALMLFGQNSEEASKKAQQQADFTKNLAQALEQSGGVIDANVQASTAQSIATDDNVKTLTKYGVAVSDVAQKLLQGNGAIDKQVASLQSQKDAITANAANYVTVFGQMGQSSQQLSATARAQVGAIDGQIDAWKALEATMPDAVKQQKAYEDAVSSSSTAMGINVGHLSTAQNAQEAYDSTLNSAVALYMQHTAAIKQYVDATVAAAGANLTARQQFEQLDDAVTSAEQAVSSAAIGVANAQHSLVDAGNAVDAARHSEQQAVLAVTEAQYQYQQSLHQEQQAQQNVMAARQAAADQLESLQRQMADQGDSLASAKLRLEQAQAAVDKAGLHGMSLADLGDPTAANEANFQLLLALSQAQHALNDTQAQGTALAKQNAEAQAAGIEGNQGVIDAEEQLAQAKHATQQAAVGVQNAQYAERQASLAVSDAVWAQHAAQVALNQAQLNSLDSQKKLTEAKENDSRTLDINTEAGNRNWQTVEDLFYKNLAATGSVKDATKATEDQTGAMGFDQGAVQGVIDTLNGLNAKTFSFSVVGTPTLDLGPVKGILQDPTLGLFTNQRGDSGGLASAGRLAAGGPVVGVGGPRDDSNLIWASAGEFMQPADAVDFYGMDFMEAIRKKRLPRFASGGPISATDGPGIMRANGGAASAWGLYETVGLTANAMGAQPQLPTKMPPPGNFSRGAFAGLAGLGMVSGKPASGGVAQAAQAYAASQLGLYGWGPDQMGPLIALWNQESGWNPWAVNPSSGAYGIPQSLGHGHVYDLGDYVAQINWGLRYIQGRYGSPAAAEGHERAFNWYRAGGAVGDGVAGLGDGGLELIRVPNGSTVLPASNTADELARMTAQPQALAVEFRFTGNTDSAMASAFMNLLRTGQIQILPQYIHK